MLSRKQQWDGSEARELHCSVGKKKEQNKVTNTNLFLQLPNRPYRYRSAVLGHYTSLANSTTIDIAALWFVPPMMP